MLPDTFAFTRVCCSAKFTSGFPSSPGFDDSVGAGCTSADFSDGRAGTRPWRMSANDGGSATCSMATGSGAGDESFWQATRARRAREARDMRGRDEQRLCPSLIAANPPASQDRYEVWQPRTWLRAQALYS